MPRLINVYSTLRQLPPISWPHNLLGSRDRTDPELADHLNGFLGFIFQNDRPMTYTRYHLMRHIQRVQHHLSLEVEDDDLDAFCEWARQANVICFMQDATVRDPEGYVLVDPETGEVEQNSAVPFPTRAHARKARVEQQLAERGITTSATLPPVIAEEEVELRSAEAVVRRAYALFAVALRAESLATENPLSREELEEKLPVAFQSLSPREEAFLAEEAPPRQAIIDHAWRYEALFLLEWALGLVPELPFPTTICDVPLTARTLLKADGFELAVKAKLRPTSEILDALDQTYRLHWRTRESRREEAPVDLDPGVIQERHHALNWLVQFEGAEWDEVDTPT
jgi:hypothetical protein